MTPATIESDKYGTLEVKKLWSALGRLLVGVPVVARFARHQNLFTTVNWYLHSSVAETPEEKAAIEFLIDFLKNDTEHMLRTWYGPLHEGAPKALEKLLGGDPR
jgi:hypothetical protein